ncbi:transcription antitermination factor NusB [Desulfovibrio sp.]|uniref:transcription antitermination factor NusB n=1 Tax=Desulfovibrio sp. TaxID=885 RepID=UPI0025C69BA3|nr:transcription antitermination factor NusB [Desulfovibrio sp.]
MSRNISLRKLPCNGRTSALRGLLLVDDGLSAQQALAAVLDGPVAHGTPDSSRQKSRAENAGRCQGLSAQDRALCTELVYGCLRTELRLNFLLGKVLPRPQGLPRPMQILLALAVYGLLFQDKVPSHAVVYEAVEQARALFGQGLARVANGALRSLQRMGEELTQPSFYERQPGAKKHRHGAGGPNSFLGQCIFYSTPLWIGELWRSAYGEEAALRLMQRSFERPWSALRINARHTDAAALYAALTAPQVAECAPAMAGLSGAATQENGTGKPDFSDYHADIADKDESHARQGKGYAPVALGTWGLAFAPGTMPREALGLDLRQWQARGALSWQSAGSQQALLALGLDRWHEPVWDACAGHGGKSAALMEWGVPVGLCTDRSFARLRGLPAQSVTLGLPVPPHCLADACRPPVVRWPGHILVDAPCSGLGVLARRPDIRRREPQHLAELEVLQQNMLGALADILQPGRELAYITCTLNPAENECAVSQLLEKNSDLTVERQWQTEHSHPWLEGMFGAVLRKKG